MLQWMLSVLTVATPAPSEMGPVLRPDVLGDEVFAESFVTFADLAGGHYAKIQLGISNAGPGDGKGACRILWIPKGASKPVKHSAIVQRDDWKHVAGTAPALHMGPCRMVAGDALTVHAPLPGMSMEIRLAGAPAKLRRHGMRVDTDGAFYELEVLVPWATAEVIVTESDGTKKTYEGHGYADHSRSNILPGKLADRWIRFRAMRSEDSQLFLIRVPPGSRRPDGWYWSQAGAAGGLRRLGMKNQGDKWRIMVDGEGGPWRFTSEDLLVRYAPVEDQGFLGTVLKAAIGNPVTYTFRATMESKRTRQKIPGILEVALSNES